MKNEFERGRKAGILSCAGIALAAGLALAIAAPRTTRAQAPAAAPGAAAPAATAPSPAPQTGAPQSATPAAAVKTAGDVYMNVTVLKAAPADQLMSAMEFISTSLGVRCNFCHVIPNFEDDSKKPKATARSMIQMEMDINKTSFQGRVEVTCNTCHRGAAHPVGVPQIPEEGQMAMTAMPPMPGIGPGAGPGAPGGPGGPGAGPNAAAPAAPAAAAPTADQIIDKYTQAIGGADAIAKLTSFKAEGTVTVEGEGGGIQSGPLEIMQEAPNKRWISLGGQTGATTEGTDGTDFWLQDARGQVRDLEGTRLVEMKRAAAMGWLLDIRKNFSRLSVSPNMDQIGDHKVYVVMAIPAGGGPRERLMFDADSGLLLRYAFVAPSPIGNNPIEGDFSDWRDAGGGLKLPFTVRKAQPGSSTTERLSKIEINVPADESKFAKPAAVQTAPPPAAAPAAQPAKP
jgi:hypothetical protein